MMGLGDIFRIGIDILTTTVNKTTNAILAQTGNVVGEVAESDNDEWWQHYGFFSRPPKPQPGKAACQGVKIESGGRNAIVASRDIRGLELYGNADHGESGIYSAGEDGKGQARVICKKDGSINVFTTDTNTADGESVYFRVAPDGFMFVAPWGTLRFDATGFHVLHESGAALDAGGIHGMPPPLDQLSSYVRATAATFTVEASAQSFGAGPPKPLTTAPEVLAALTALQTQITALAKAWTTLGAMTGPILGAAVTPVAALVETATAAGTVAVTAAGVAMQSTTSSS